MSVKLFNVRKNVIEGLDEKLISVLGLSDGDEVEAVTDRNAVLLRKGGKVCFVCGGGDVTEIGNGRFMCKKCLCAVKKAANM